MLFNSLKFAIFLPIVFIFYYIAPKKYRWGAILVANCVFYAGFGFRNFVILLLATAVSYGAGLLVAPAVPQNDMMPKGASDGQSADKPTKKLAGVISVLLFVGALVFYKYTDFILETIYSVGQAFDLNFKIRYLNLIAPVGISFYTFKAVSYIADVSKGRMMPVTHFGKFSTYLSFFPQVASGPIERPESFFATLEEEKSFEYEYACDALKLMVWGFFKKMIVADKLAGYVDKVYSDTASYSGFSLMAVIFFFTIQIYCDFSGYSDIANGVARLLGFSGTENFKSPYFASSIKEFWARWHISLSSWFRDYIYIPLGGNRKGTFRYAINIMITFLVSGLWHGAAWTFVVWGALHGFMQVVETLAHKAVCRIKNIDPKDKKYTKKGVYKWISVVFVFIFVNIAWVFFKANTLSDAFYVLRYSFNGITSPINYIKSGLNVLGIDSNMFIHLIIVIAMVFVVDLINLKNDAVKLMWKLPKAARWVIYVVFVDLIIIWFLQYGADSSSFVYFNF